MAPFVETEQSRFHLLIGALKGVAEADNEEFTLVKLNNEEFQRAASNYLTIRSTRSREDVRKEAVELSHRLFTLLKRSSDAHTINGLGLLFGAIHKDCYWDDGRPTVINDFLHDFASKRLDEMRSNKGRTIGERYSLLFALLSTYNPERQLKDYEHQDLRKLWIDRLTPSWSKAWEASSQSIIEELEEVDLKYPGDPRLIYTCACLHFKKVFHFHFRQ